MDYNAFKDTVIPNRKGKGKRKIKVTNSFGIYDCYKLIRKNGWYNIGRPLKEHEFYSVIRQVNLLLAKELANGNTVKFPYGMGVLELRKYKRGVSIVNGKLKNTYPIDWNSTLRLWYEDEESKRNKTLLRYEVGELYSIRYSKFKAKYNNRSFYEFVLNTYIKKALAYNIKNRKTDTLW